MGRDHFAALPRTRSCMNTELPWQVQNFVAALIANARTVEGWETPDLAGGKCFAETIAYVKKKPDGSIQVCDNYEKFFDIIYLYTPGKDVNEEGMWTIRHMYSDEPAESYSYEQCMADASIMFTG